MLLLRHLLSSFVHMYIKRGGYGQINLLSLGHTLASLQPAKTASMVVPLHDKYSEEMDGHKRHVAAMQQSSQHCFWLLCGVTLPTLRPAYTATLIVFPFVVSLAALTLSTASPFSNTLSIFEMFATFLNVTGGRHKRLLDCSP